MRVFVCFLGVFVANGLARFGYVVLIPLLILSGSLTPHQSFQLGIAVLMGYVFGSFLIQFLSPLMSLESIAKISFGLIALSFLVCYFDSIPFFWLWIWRFIAGVASSALMILVAPLSLPYVKEHKKALVGGLIFSAVGIGSVFSGFVLPWISSYNIKWAWIFLGGSCLIAFILSLVGLKTRSLRKKSVKKEESAFKIPFHLWLLLISCALNAIGFLPHTLFWVDYLIRHLNISPTIAGTSWAFFGFGATLGSLISGPMAQKLGAKNANIFILILKSIACFLPIFFHQISLLNLSIFIMGAATTANINLFSMMALKIAGAKHFAQASSWVVFSFGIFQALFSYLFTIFLGDLGYVLIFVICGVCLVLSFIVLFPIKMQTATNK
ncbi:YbfB/YjiJ family MFS transporter [Helicobacter pylori]|uniref:YbfB/YjiJ family MFS transporter n=1 Tax=Helicobacter pylori TaxID=210 RepID=UPI0007208F60|nr:YbfB/YjiJ family MFS transporter [Helicobacter pylori]ALM78977.1 MFS transporter [Helicobacter pylori]MBH0299965.1 YbfB/YjiJ family MFS transporter [Helicobacter pylori]